MKLILKAIAYKGPSQTVADACYNGLNALSKQNYIVPRKDHFGNVVENEKDTVLDHAERYMEDGNYVVVAYMKEFNPDDVKQETVTCQIN